LALDYQPPSVLTDLGDAAQPLSVRSVESSDGCIAIEPQHRPEVMRLADRKLHCAVWREPAFYVEARLPMSGHFCMPHLLRERD
jgi:hypothetical protein